jgi:hypothetical protein
MKELLIELRLLMAEKLLGWAFDIAPAGEPGDTMRVAIKRYFEYAVKKTAAEISNGE